MTMYLLFPDREWSGVCAFQGIPFQKSWLGWFLIEINKVFHQILQTTACLYSDCLHAVGGKEPLGLFEVLLLLSGGWGGGQGEQLWMKRHLSSNAICLRPAKVGGILSFKHRIFCNYSMVYQMFLSASRLGQCLLFLLLLEVWLGTLCKIRIRC